MDANMSINATEAPGPASIYSKSEQIILGIVLFSIVFVSIVGNIMVIIAVLSFKRLRDNVTNYFIISLAVADLMLSTFVMPYNAVNEILGYWPFGIVFCDIYQALDILSCTASILNLCVISLDRYLAITSPFTYYERITHKTVGILIAVVWCIAFLISALPVNLDFHEDPDLAEIGWYTDPQFCVLAMNPTFALVSSVISFYIPMTIILFVYARIFVVARRQARQIAAYENTAKRFAGTSKKSMARERKAAKTLAIIVGVFIACWLPFFIVNLVDPFCGRCIDVTLFTVLVWLGFVNSSLNPLIYAQNKTFRRAFKSLLWCYTCKGIQMRDTDTSDAENTAMTNAPAGQYRTKTDGMNSLATSRANSRNPSTVAVSTISTNVVTTTSSNLNNNMANDSRQTSVQNDISTVPKSDTVEELLVTPDDDSQGSNDNSNRDDNQTVTDQNGSNNNVTQA
ncbi:D(1) dopamine receptor-like [Amphiura filiformis]|uniref:D(1) dopamine receptor-like n=1 Tax=Amphiura filiformis TaxID=82378 RepID=UPI003B20C019